jgi:hypothetical protein
MKPAGSRLVAKSHTAMAVECVPSGEAFTDCHSLERFLIRRNRFGIHNVWLL